jgi:hypothetical protein
MKNHWLREVLLAIEIGNDAEQEAARQLITDGDTRTLGTVLDVDGAKQTPRTRARAGEVSLDDDEAREREVVDAGLGDTLCLRAVLRPGSASLERWIENALRARGAQMPPDDVLKSFDDRTLGHLLAQGHVQIEAPTVDGTPPFKARPTPDAERKRRTPWASHPWAYKRRSAVPRRKAPHRLMLHAPEFDYRWADEFRMVLLVAPYDRVTNSIPLLRMYVLKRLYKYLHVADLRQLWNIIRATWDVSVPDSLSELNTWYPLHRQDDERSPLRDPPWSDLTDWTSKRLLQGFAPFALQRRADGHRDNNRGEDEAYLIAIDWDDVRLWPFKYELPNVRVFFRAAPDEGGRPAPGLAVSRIEIARRRWWHRLRRLDHKPPSDRGKYFDTETFTPEDAPVRWKHAMRVARGVALYSGELDQHLARSHLLTETAALMWQVHGQTPALRPLWQMMRPFLRDVDGINNLGDALVLGWGGVLTDTSGLTAGEVGRRLNHQIGETDWKGFAPRRAPPPHAQVDARQRRTAKGRGASVDPYTEATNVFWEIINDFVDRWFDERVDDQHAALCDLAEMVRQHNAHRSTPAARAPTPHPGYTFCWPGELSRAAPAPKGAKHLSVPDPNRPEEGRQLCKWFIFHATVFHGWVNDRGWIDGGSLEHATFGLRHLRPPAEDTRAAWKRWLDDAGPNKGDASMQLSIGWTLDKMKWGLFGDIHKQHTHETVDKLHFDETEVFEAFQAEVTAERRARLRAIDRPFEGWRCRVNS